MGKIAPLCQQAGDYVLSMGKYDEKNQEQCDGNWHN